MWLHIQDNIIDAELGCLCVCADGAAQPKTRPDPEGAVENSGCDGGADQEQTQEKHRTQWENEKNTQTHTQQQLNSLIINTSVTDMSDSNMYFIYLIFYLFH